MRNISLRLFALFAFAVALTVSGVGNAEAKVELIKKADSFVMFLDHSGSMGMKHMGAGKDKIQLAKQVAGEMNTKIPALGYQGAAATFAPYSKLWQGPHGKGALGDAIGGIAEEYPIFGRKTPMGDGLSSLVPVLDELPGKIAVILFADGENNTGSGAVAEAKALYDVYAGRLCIHVVSFADTAKGQATLDAIADIASCSVAANGPALLESQASMDSFVRDVFYDEKMIEEPKPEPAPAPVEEVVEIIPLRVQFDFDSAAIRADMKPILDEAAVILEETEGPVTLEGHTCRLGAAAYNQKLSERRAASVKKYLVNKGVDASRIKSGGLGESAPKYDNDTKEGRKLNRRVEIVIGK